MQKLWLVLLIISISAQAQSGGLVASGSGSSPTSITGSQNVVDSGNIYNNPPAVNTTTVNLATSNDTCAESMVAGGSGAGIGINVGKTFVSEPCNIRYNASQMAALGRPDIAREMMCAMDNVYEADIRVAIANGTRPLCAKRGDQTPPPKPAQTGTPNDNR